MRVRQGPGRPDLEAHVRVPSLAAFADHGQDGSGELLAIMLRLGNAGSNTAADHVEATKLALAQLPPRLRKRVLIRAVSGGGTHDFLSWLNKPGRRLEYSVGMTITEDMHDAIGKIPARAWTPACDSDRQVRDGAWVAEITSSLTVHRSSSYGLPGANTKAKNPPM